MNNSIKRAQSQARSSFAERENQRSLAGGKSNFRPKVKQLKKTLLTLVALLAVTTGAWAETGENIFQYCYDCQRNPAYPKTTASASLSGFANPLVGYKGSGFDVDNTSAGPWKLEYMGLWSTTDKHEVEDVSYYQYTYNCTDVPVFRLYQWNATANEYQHAAYGVVCAYAKVSNAVEHTAMFVSKDGWGCVLTNSSHSSSMNITFDEDLTTGLTTIIAAATPASSGPEVAWNAAENSGTFTMPGGNVTLEPEYYPQAALTAAPTAINNVPATTDGAIVNAGTVANIGETTTAQGTVMYYVSQSALDDAALLALAADKWTADVPTAADLAQGQAYVYYYVRGNDSDNDEENFSDGDILAANALTVTIAAEPTYAVTFAEGTDPNEWSASPAADVKKGQTVTVTYTGSKKVIGVKAEKKSSAPSLNITNPVVGQVIGSDGKNYNYGAVPTGVTAVAKICYVSGSHGLALALTDEGAMNWSTAIETCAAHTPAFTGGTWKLATKDEWNSMITAAGSSTDLREGFVDWGGTNMQSDVYWSSTEDGSSDAWYYVFIDGYSDWYVNSKDDALYVRACLAF